MHLTHTCTCTCALRIIVVPHDTLKDKVLPPLSGHLPITDTLIWPEQCPLNGGTTVFTYKNVDRYLLSPCDFATFRLEYIRLTTVNKAYEPKWTNLGP